MSQKLQNILNIFFQNNFAKPAKSIAIAVSGGVDSLALTFLLHDFCLENNIKLFAVTIDHKMRQSSSKEAAALSKILQKNKITHEILAINKKDLPKTNIEANLREARYEMLYNFCSKNKIEHLFLGHHLGDVAENFLIRLFRGSQLDGLSAMQEVLRHKKIKLCRPLLNVEKDELKKYLQAKKIKWFEDESNDDEKFLRNKMRKFFDSFEEKNLIQKRIKNAAEIIKESKDFIDDVLLREAAICLDFKQDRSSKISAKEASFTINLKNYQKIPPNIALKILSLVLIEASGNPYKPRLEGLKNFEKNILTLAKGKKKNFYGCMALGLENQAVTIYRDETEAQNPPQKFDEKTMIIDGRFFAKLDKNKKPTKSHKFYFRTILRKVF